MRDVMHIYMCAMFGRENIITTGLGNYIVRGLGLSASQYDELRWNVSDSYWDYDEVIEPHQLMGYVHFLRKKMHTMINEDTAYLESLEGFIADYKPINVYREYVEGGFDLADSQGNVKRKLRVEVLENSNGDYYLVGHLGEGITPIKSTLKIHSIGDIDRAIAECYEFLGLTR